jgi:hypothetical protein
MTIFPIGAAAIDSLYREVSPEKTGRRQSSLATPGGG